MIPPSALLAFAIFAFVASLVIGGICACLLYELACAIRRRLPAPRKPAPIHPLADYGFDRDYGVDIPLTQPRRLRDDRPSDPGTAIVPVDPPVIHIDSSQAELFAWYKPRTDRERRWKSTILERAAAIRDYHPRLTDSEVESLARDDWDPASGKCRKSGAYWWSHKRCSTYYDEYPLYRALVGSAYEYGFSPAGMTLMDGFARSLINAYGGGSGALECEGPDPDVVSIPGDVCAQISEGMNYGAYLR